MKKGLRKVSDTVTDKLENVIKTNTFFEQYVVKRFQPMFKRLQQKRWQTENSSEGKRWDPILPRYAEWKKKKYSGSFGKGENLLIATGRLFKGLTLSEDGEWERILLRNTVVLNFPIYYASQVDSFRPILDFSEASITMIKNDFRKFMRQSWQV